jgi:hypothetical protein
MKKRRFHVVLENFVAFKIFKSSWNQSVQQFQIQDDCIKIELVLKNNVMWKCDVFTPQCSRQMHKFYDVAWDLILSTDLQSMLVFDIE